MCETGETPRRLMDRLDLLGDERQPGDRVGVGRGGIQAEEAMLAIDLAARVCRLLTPT